jgi:hypothetical protein
MECSIDKDRSIDMVCSIDMEYSIDMNMQQGHGMQYGLGHVAGAWTCSMDMQHGHVLVAWTRTRSTDLLMRHGPGQGHAWMHGCRNAGLPIKSSVRHSLFSVRLQRLVRHRHSGIMVSPVLLISDYFVSAQH